jgi:hypothetical protein
MINVMIKGALVVTLAVVMPGCLVDMLMTTAITADMAAQQASSATGTLNQAQYDVSKMELEEALEYYYYEKEAYPRSLNELAPQYIDEVPMRPDGEPFGYNPIEGTIYPNNKGPSTADYFLMEDIKVAINNYGNATGLYPPSLDDLYPNFMPSPPRTSTGEQFGYDNQNGNLTHPREGMQHEVLAASPDSGSSDPVKPANAIGSLEEGDLENSDSLNSALDRMGY